MFEFIGKNILGKDGDDAYKRDLPPFTFDHEDSDDSYRYPDLYDEAEGMLQASMLIYRPT